MIAAALMNCGRAPTMVTIFIGGRVWESVTASRPRTLNTANHCRRFDAQTRRFGSNTLLGSRNRGEAADETLRMSTSSATFWMHVVLLVAPRMPGRPATADARGRVS